jgi:O-antigen/teichoic acid export membrane protein
LQWLPIYAGPVVAGSFLGIRELGILQLAYKTVEYPRVLVTIAFRLSMSVFSRAGKTVNEVRESLKKILDVLFFVLIPAMGIIVAMSPAWIPVVYGISWMQMSKVMIIIIFPHLTMAMMMILSSLMSARGSAKTSSLFYSMYNIAYWVALVLLTYAIGFFALPFTEWVALAGCIIPIRAIKASGIGTNVIFKYLGVLFTASLGAALLWNIASYRTLTETLIAGIIMTCLWFLLSPARKEIVTWVKQHHALDAEYKAVSAKSKK